MNVAVVALLLVLLVRGILLGDGDRGDAKDAEEEGRNSLWVVTIGDGA